MSATRQFVIALFGLALASASASAADWETTTTDQISKEKLGYGGLSGVAVDHATGTVYVNLSDRGVFRSKDQGTTWERVGKEFKGRTEQPGCLLFDSSPTQLLCATVYGGPVAVARLEDDVRPHRRPALV